MNFKDVFWNLVSTRQTVGVYFTYDKNIWQDICLLLGMWIRISISLLILSNILWKSHVTMIFSQKSIFAYSLCILLKIVNISKIQGRAYIITS